MRAALPLALLVAALASGPLAAAEKAKVGDPAPAFSLTDLDGQRLELAALRGKVVVLDFWATWCAPCRSQIPQYVALQKKYAPRGLVVVGLSLDDSPGPVRAFRKELGMTYRVAMADAKLAARFGGVMGLPTAFVIDRAGRIRGRHEGGNDVPAVEADVRKLLEEK